MIPTIRAGLERPDSEGMPKPMDRGPRAHVRAVTTLAGELPKGWQDFVLVLQRSSLLRDKEVIIRKPNLLPLLHVFVQSNDCRVVQGNQPTLLELRLSNDEYATREVGQAERERLRDPQSRARKEPEQGVIGARS